MDNMRAISSWSGGKDSCLAYYKALLGGYKIKYLLHFISRESKRSCFHGIELNLMKLQAEALGATLVQKEVTADMKEYEKEFKEAVCELKKEGINKMVFGDIYLLDQINWVERVCKEIGINPVEPLWNNDPMRLAQEFINLGFKAVVVSAKDDKGGKDFIGKVLDKDILREFKPRGICPCGENGEYHTFVVDGPIFKKRIEITEAEPIFKDGFWKHWFLDIKKYSLLDKH